MERRETSTREGRIHYDSNPQVWSCVPSRCILDRSSPTILYTQMSTLDDAAAIAHWNTYNLQVNTLVNIEVVYTTLHRTVVYTQIISWNVTNSIVYSHTTYTNLSSVLLYNRIFYIEPYNTVMYTHPMYVVVSVAFVCSRLPCIVSFTTLVHLWALR